jgi:hypothetical protein
MTELYDSAMKFIQFEGLLLRVHTDYLNWSMRRAGNSRSTGLCYDVPKSIKSLANCESGSGHDGFLSTIHVLIDWKINKIVREQLLRYSFINVCSSNSLMYRCEELTGCKTPDEVPNGYEYWISFSASYLQLKTIFKQRRRHKRHEWRGFCNALYFLPYHELITGPMEANDDEG